jgi:alkanesulfonate monooxygenase SsuD/methylene tetrahydromethanopterin reductase-like flavin-dependent oxidoreductase (luciferase family)
MAVRTRHIRIGAMLTPPARRRPWKLARETATVDHLSNGRLILPVGLGALDDGGFTKVGEPTDRKVRAERLDESLAILSGLWRGQPFSFQGRHYQMDEMTFDPAPVQSPRIPIWVVGVWPHMKSMKRVVRYDGWLPNGDTSPAGIRAGREWIEAHRTQNTPFDVIWEGETPGDDPAKGEEIIGPYAAAGITWWMESRWGQPVRVEEARARIRQAPPRG